MDVEISAGEWAHWLGRRAASKTIARFSAFHRDQTILITGAGGSIGSALALQVAKARPRALILFDAYEQGLYQVESLIAAASVPSIAVLGSVTDRELLDEVFRLHRPDLIYHAAAHKHVPLMEANPFAAMRNNALGTGSLARAAAEHRIPRVLMISTDKAANPASVMGASKRIAELVLQTGSNIHSKMNSIRMGNVLGSQGSVVPRFLDQIRQGGPVTVACPEVERFFWTMDETVSLIFEAATCAQGGQILVPDIEKSVSILELANYLIKKHGGLQAEEIQIVFSGLRPGDKLKEEFVADDERVVERVGERLHGVQGGSLSADQLASALAELDRTTRTRNLVEMLRVLRQMVPQYEPGPFLSASNVTALASCHG